MQEATRMDHHMLEHDQASAGIIDNSDDDYPSSSEDGSYSPSPSRVIEPEVPTPEISPNKPRARPPASCCILAEILKYLDLDDLVCEYTRENYRDLYSDCILTHVVKSSKVVGGIKPKHVVYDVVTEIPKKFSFQVSRRYTDFEALARVLPSLDSTSIIQDIPKKHSFLEHLQLLKRRSGPDSELIKKRKFLFQRFLTKALIYPKIRGSHIIHEFLTNKNEWIETLRDNILVDDQKKLNLSLPLAGNFYLGTGLSEIGDKPLQKAYSSSIQIFESVQRMCDAIKNLIDAIARYARQEEDTTLVYNTSSLSELDLSCAFENLSHVYHISNTNYLNLVEAIKNNCYYPLMSIMLTKGSLELVLKNCIALRTNIHTTSVNALLAVESSGPSPDIFSGTPEISGPNQTGAFPSNDEGEILPASPPLRAASLADSENDNISSSQNRYPQRSDPLNTAAAHIEKDAERAKAKRDESYSLFMEFLNSTKSNMELYNKLCKREVKNVLLSLALSQANFHKKSLGIWKEALQQQSGGSTLGNTESTD